MCLISTYLCFLFMHVSDVITCVSHNLTFTSNLEVFHLILEKMPLTLTVVVVLLAVIPPSMAEIKSLVISDDARPMILLEKFGFTHTGHVTVSVSSVSTSSEPSRLGFFLLLEIQQNPRFCVLDSHNVTQLFTFRDLSPPPNSRFNQSYPVTSPNEYSLYFANCVPETKVSMAVRTEMYNKDPNGAKDYLPAGHTQLPTLYSFFFLCYVAFLGFWSYTCWTNKPTVHRIHLLMAGLLVIKSLNLICAAGDKHYVKITGTPHGWDILLYIFQSIRVVLLFNVIILIGTGWSLLKPFLQEKEKTVLIIVTYLQVLANIASIVIGKTGPFIKDWVTWNQVFLLLDTICCCAIIFPIVWSIRALKETSKTDGKAARNLAKLRLFWKFYIVVVEYLFFTRFLVFALKATTAYEYQWMSFAAEEIVCLVFYVIMFYMFRPEEKNEYFVVDDDDDDEEAPALALRPRIISTLRK